MIEKAAVVAESSEGNRKQQPTVLPLSQQRVFTHTEPKHKNHDW
jgi:hypothetical protein